MSVYYNEFDPFAAQWLRELIKCGFIADGVVDDRSITEVKADDLKEFTQCHFFAGIGGWSYALRLAGVSDGARLWTGSCPCQSFSVAGKQKGFDDERHLWPVFSKLIDECKPSIVFGEQVETAIKHGWLDLVQDDLESYGYACASAVLPAACVGAPHIRHRLYWGGGYPTPTVTDSTGRKNSNCALHLPGVAVAMATPRVFDWKEKPSMKYLLGRKDGKLRDDRLVNQAMLINNWRTPTVSDAEGGIPKAAYECRLKDFPSALKNSYLAVSTFGAGLSGGSAKMEKSAQLNPGLSRWLMGFPPEWDVCAVMAMQSFPKSQRNLSKHF